MWMVSTFFYTSAAIIADVEGDAVKNTTQQKSDLAALIGKMPKISGYLQTGWNYSTAGDGTSSFQAKRLRLLADGTVTPKLAFRLQIEAFNYDISPGTLETVDFSNIVYRMVCSPDILVYLNI